MAVARHVHDRGQAGRHRAAHRHPVALDEAPPVAHHVGVARAERCRQQHRPAVGDRCQAADDRAADMELRQRVDLHRARLEVEHQHVGPGRDRQRAVGVARELGQAGRAAGMEQRGHRVALERLGRQQPVARLFV